MGDQDELAGRIAAVTGAGSGLGAAMSRRFAQAGMAVAALDIDEAAARATAATLADDVGVPTMAARVDVGDAASLAEAAAAVAAGLGGCDVVCANVGVQQFGAIDRSPTTTGPGSSTSTCWDGPHGGRVPPPAARASGLPPGRPDGVVGRARAGPAPGRLPDEQVRRVRATGRRCGQELAAEGIGVTIVFPAGMMTRHLESSARARPADKGEWVLLDDDIEVMMAGRGMGEEHIATPEHATRHLVADLLAGRPYVITHGQYRADLHVRLAELEEAFDRMERS